jgi:alanine-glyoxylate transaminase/serine-glyoxylate transaminase/serine-pyruvate transaminase
LDALLVLASSWYQDEALRRSRTARALQTLILPRGKTGCPVSHIDTVGFPSLTLLSIIVMQNYEANKPSYFATPSPQLIRALNVTLKQILAKPLEDRFAAHKASSEKIKKAVAALGLKQLASKSENQANGMTAIYLPDGYTPPDVLPSLIKKGVIFAGGLHRDIATKYIRIGHMGISVTNPARGDIDLAIKALKDTLTEVGYKIPE